MDNDNWLVSSIKIIIALLEIIFYTIYKNILRNHKLKMVWLISFSIKVLDCWDQYGF